jgi:gas vesicle protein
MTSNYPLPVDGFAPPAAPTAPLPMAPPPSSGEELSTAAVAKDQAASVGQSAAEAGQQVAAVAKDQAGQVAAEAGRQAKDLLGQAQGQLSEQAGAQQEKLVKALQSLRDELRSMAQNADQPGVGSDMARQAADRAGTIAGWLDGREPSALLDDVTAFARRRPGAFLAAAAGIGLLAGRLTSGIKAQPSTTEQTAVTTPTSPSTIYSPPIAVVPAVGLAQPLAPLAPLAPPATALPTNGYLAETQP